MPIPPAATPDDLLLWRFAQVRFDERRREIEREDGSIVALERKANDMLRHLLRHAGEVVTKDELFDQVWPGRILTEGVLSKTVARLRQAIGDVDQQVIRTVSGVGYRLVAQVAGAPAPSGPGLRSMELVAGQRLPQRPDWRLEERLDHGSPLQTWRLRQVDSGEQRLFRFCDQEQALDSLKREVTISRLLSQGQAGHRACHVCVLDWNMEHSPYWIELPWLPDGSLADWWRTRRGQWPLAERIELAADIAQALAVAHGLGVLHKDLKPAHILIDRTPDGRPTARLAGFGSARLLEPERLERYRITRQGFQRPTLGGNALPLYRAPEVLRGEPSTLAADLYGLGVLLYQLVIDDPMQPIAPGWERAISDAILREDIAALVEGDPNLRLADAAAVAQRLRQLAPRRAERERDRQLRHDAEQALIAADHARQRRNVALAFTAVLLLALVATGSLFLRARDAAEQARQQAERADREAAQAAAVSEFLTDDLLAMADPFVAGEHNLTVRQAIEFARGSIEHRFAGQPDLEAAVRLRIALSLRNLDDRSAAREELQRALTISHDEAQRAHIQLALAWLADDNDQPEQALEHAQSAHSLTEIGSIQRLRIETELAWLEHRQGRYETARDQLQSLLAQIEESSTADTSSLRERIRGHLANTYSVLGDDHRAEALWRQVVQASTHSTGHPAALSAQRSLGRVLSRLQRHDEAITLLQQAHDQALARLGAEHSQRLETLNELATALQHGGALDHALPLFQELLRIRLQHWGDHHSGTRTAMNNYAMALNLSEQPEAALTWYRRAYEAEVAELGEQHPDTLILSHNLARSLRNAGHLDEAEPLQRRTLELAREQLPAEHWQLAIYMATLAETLEQRGQIEQALELAEPAAAMLTTSFGTDHTRSRHARAIVERLHAAR